MKLKLIAISAFSIAILFSGCSTNVKEEYTLDENAVTELYPGYYVKGVYVDRGGSGGYRDVLYVHCKQDGTPIEDNSIKNFSEPEGKSYKGVAFVDNTSKQQKNETLITDDANIVVKNGQMTQQNKSKYTIQCNTVKECENKVNFMKSIFTGNNE